MIGTHLGVKRFIEIGWSHGCDHFSTAYQERKCEVAYRTRVNNTSNHKPFNFCLNLEQMVHSGLTNEMPFVELNNVLYIYQLGIIYAIFWLSKITHRSTQRIL